MAKFNAENERLKRIVFGMGKRGSWHERFNYHKYSRLHIYRMRNLQNLKALSSLTKMML